MIISPREVLDAMIQPGVVSELRIPGTNKGTVSGYFDDHAKMAEAAERWSGRAPGIYFTPNPVAPELLARAYNRVAQYSRVTTTDRDIMRLLWLLIDCDPIRPAGISATEQEHELALATARTIRDYLSGLGWPVPILGDSGNGGHLEYSVDLATTDFPLLQRVLVRLAAEFDTDKVKVDKTTFNPARIWKLPGTMACKGDDMPDRPHRQSSILELPERRIAVTREQLEQLADQMPPSPSRRTKETTTTINPIVSDPTDWARKRIRKHADRLPPMSEERAWNGGGWKRTFDYCPWNPDHTTTSAYVACQPDGAAVAGCLHDSCSQNDWNALMQKVGHVDGRAYTSKDRTKKQSQAKASTEEKQPEPKTTVVFTRPAITGSVRECVLLSVKDGEYDGWFGRGRVHLVNGSSGAGKTTLMVDLLYQQQRAERYLGHLGAGLPFLILFADRGDLSNQETLARMRLTDANLNIKYLPFTTSGWESVCTILQIIEAEDAIPGAVFIEGADMLVEDAIKASFVAPFLHALQRIAAHYHIAMILSVGSAKSRPKEQYTNRRDRSFGSEKWGRMSDTIVALAIPPGGDDTDQRRVLDVLHRNARAERFDLTFSEGLLVPYIAPAEEMDAFTYWVSARDWFTLPEATKGLKGEMSQASIYRRKEEAWKAGNLEQKIDEATGGFLYRWRSKRSHENGREN